MQRHSSGAIDGEVPALDMLLDLTGVSGTFMICVCACGEERRASYLAELFQMRLTVSVLSVRVSLY